MLSIIVAKASNNAIGKDNKLLWNIKDDLRRFKEITQGHTIIMGSKTFKSLRRVLPNRFHVVLTRNKDFVYDDKNVKIIHNFDEIEQYIKDNKENFVIGGGIIYKMLLPSCNRLYVTEIEKEFEADTFFPDIKKDEWKIVKIEDGPKDENDFKYKYINYERIK